MIAPRNLTMSSYPTVLRSVLTALACAAAAVAGAAEPALELMDLAGKRHAPLAVGGVKPVVLIFVTPYCPSANAFMPEVSRIMSLYGARADFYLVHADPAVKAADAAKQAEMFALTATVLLDPACAVARAAQATVTPEVVVRTAGRTVYQGRINDLYLNRTRKQAEPKSHDLVAALDAILAGRPVANPLTKAIGCSIPQPD